MTCETTTCKCVGEYCKCNQETDECTYEIPNETFSNFVPMNTVSRSVPQENSSSLLMLILALVIAGVTYYNRKSLNSNFAITCYVVAAAFIIISSNQLITKQYKSY